MKQDKLINLFDFLPKSKVKAGDGLQEGKYPFYASSENQTKYLDEYQHEPGCLVFGTGGKASVHFTTTRFATSTDCITIHPKPKANIDAGYVFQFFKGNMQVLETGFKGAGLKHISKAYLSDIQIPHPEEIGNQKRIAHLLGKVEWLIAQRKQHLQQLDALLKSIFLEMFGDPVRNAKGWETAEIEKFCEEVIDCPHSTPIYSVERSGYYCVRSGDIVAGYLDLSKTLHVGRDVYEARIKRYTPQIGDIVYSREGGRLGNAARILGHESICLGQRIMLFKVNEENNVDFLWALLESRSFKTKLQGMVGGGGAPRVNIKDLIKITVIQPPNDIQIQFSRITARIDQIKSHYQRSLTDMEQLYGALSQKAFKGELDLSRVPLPTENPEIAAEEKFEAENKQPKEPLFAMPETEELAILLQSAEGRKKLLGQWLDAWIAYLDGAPFEAQPFMETSRQWLWQLTEGESPDWGVAEYDELKAWIFEALEQGRLTQTYDDDNNRVRITAAKG
jgi:type I restriction enzyme S subunit